MNNNDNSGVNTILIVVLIIIAVAGFVWYFVGSTPAAPAEDASFEVDVNLPEVPGDSEPAPEAAPQE